MLRKQMLRKQILLLGNKKMFFALSQKHICFSDTNFASTTYVSQFSHPRKHDSLARALRLPLNEFDQAGDVTQDVTVARGLVSAQSGLEGHAKHNQTSHLPSGIHLKLKRDEGLRLEGYKMKLGTLTVIYATIFASMFIFSEGERLYRMVCSL